MKRRQIAVGFRLSLVMICCGAGMAQAQPRIYRDQVKAQWFGDQTQFWYRNDLPDSSREFILVNAAEGTRRTAFDHAMAAAQFSEILQREIAPDQLPVESLEFANDKESLTLLGREGRFRLDRASGELIRESSGGDSKVTRLFLPVRPSASSNEETEIVVQNKLDQPVTLVWIDSSEGCREYGSVNVGESRRQHTFAGHIWLFRMADGTDIGCIEAQSGGSQVTIDQAAVESVDTEPPRRRPGRQRPAPQNPVSPDGELSVFAQENNLRLRIVADGAESLLSSDATPGNTFRRDASRARSMGLQYDLPDFPEDLVDAHWSTDSNFVVAMQTTQLDSRLVYYVESTPKDQVQPELRSYPYAKPGDPIPVSVPRLFRISDRQEITISRDLFPNPWSLEFLRWSNDGTRFWLLYNERGHQRLRVLEVTVESGTVRTIVDEHSDTFIHYSSDGKFELRWLPKNQLLWASERSGWNHLYRYDVLSGEVLNAVTVGDWNVRRIERIDEATGLIWFFAVGIRPDQDPYHEHFCRVHPDGTGLTILTEGDGTHDIQWSPDRRWFIDRFSRVDLPPVTELRTADGELVCRLEAADASEIITNRGSLPERFTAKGRDGKTDIWGIVHRPRNFDPSKSYSVIENIYAGPHDHHVPKAFAAQFGHQHRIADQGFVVVQIDGMGTAWRSKAFHDVCWRNLRDAGFPDRIAWMKALQQKMPQLDLSRVGIYGGSAGGQNALAALLWHGDFYKAAVADCGCHDNRMDKIWWNEQWMGPPEGDHYERNSNTANAHLLQGRLMLVVGELDRNVDPATTAQVARKLIDADKDFEFVVVPGAGHGACETPWASRKRTAFFLRELRLEP